MAFWSFVRESNAFDKRDRGLNIDVQEGRLSVFAAFSFAILLLVLVRNGDVSGIALGCGNVDDSNAALSVKGCELLLEVSLSLTSTLPGLGATAFFECLVETM